MKPIKFCAILFQRNVGNVAQFFKFLIGGEKKICQSYVIFIKMLGSSRGKLILLVSEIEKFINF